ncbi:unnamed protein product [Paramecium primaurelia]|uniref:Uncharacterized protein n=1 Tax=Paramecium primaurelia TaxID=5886 RepID=A0A8S1QTX4_PARPR|nr:unnamed protein product [Paramecium primaurelia]
MKIQLGRPKISQDQIENKIYTAPDQNNTYIQQDSDCVKLFKLFATQGRYKIRILTQNKQIENQDRLEMKKLQQLFQKKDNCPSFFFLSQRNKNYSFENQILVDKTSYISINSQEFDPKFKILINKLNIVLKELDEQFISILVDILLQYTNLYDWNLDQNQIMQYIIEEIQDPQNDLKYQYLLKWKQIKYITKEIRMNMLFENLENTKTQINKRTSQKVINKLQKFIEKQERHLNKENKMKPIEYLISKLIRIFNKIMTKN